MITTFLSESFGSQEQVGEHIRIDDGLPCAQPPALSSIVVVHCIGTRAMELPDWEKLLAAERHLQFLIPGTTLVGGTAAAIHAGHRVSQDGDHAGAGVGGGDRARRTGA